MARPEQPVSRLGDLIRLFTALLGGIGDGTEIMVGKRYLEEFGIGAPPRILFVPSPEGELGGVQKMSANYVASFGDACLVYVRAAESGDDVGRLDNVDRLVDRVVNTLKACGAVHIEIARSRPRDNSPLSVDAYGADKVFQFMFRRGIPRIPEIWSAPQTPVSPPNYDQPGGDTGETFTVSTSTSAVRP